MTNESEGWSAASAALDHRDTVKALAAILPGWWSEGDPDVDTAAAETMAAGLARQGLVLVPLDSSAQPDLGTGDRQLQDGTSTDWFKREVDR